MVLLGLSPIQVHTINQERNESVTAREVAPKVSPSSSLVAKRERLVGPQVITIYVTLGEKGAPFIGGYFWRKSSHQLRCELLLQSCASTTANLQRMSQCKSSLRNSPATGDSEIGSKRKPELERTRQILNVLHQLLCRSFGLSKLSRCLNRS